MEQKGSSAARTRVCGSFPRSALFLPPSQLGCARPWKMAAKNAIQLQMTVMMYKWIDKLDFLRTIELGELLVKRSGRHAGIVLQRFDCSFRLVDFNVA